MLTTTPGILNLWIITHKRVIWISCVGNGRLKIKSILYFGIWTNPSLKLELNNMYNLNIYLQDNKCSIDLYGSEIKICWCWNKLNNIIREKNVVCHQRWFSQSSYCSGYRFRKYFQVDLDPSSYAWILHIHSFLQLHVWCRPYKRMFLGTENRY